MSEHTPGPWCLVETTDPNIISSWAVHIGERRLPLFPYRQIYSEDRTQSGYIKDPQYMADARLIAAAPDLLAALQDLAEAVESMQATFGCIRGDTPEDDDMHIHEKWAEDFLKERMLPARAAIAKAEGA